MLPCYISCLFLTLKVALGVANESSPAVEKKDPPNEWGTYYYLPGNYSMQNLFSETFGSYANFWGRNYVCQDAAKKHLRWYISSKNSDHVLFSYYCLTEGRQGYKHMNVSRSKKGWGVVRHSPELKTFGIKDAGDYEDELPEAEGKKLLTELLPNVTDSIKQQKNEAGSKGEICPNPGNETFHKAYNKTENGLYYYKFAISCKVYSDSVYPSHKTNIEIVIDKDFKALNEGKPVLATMETPIRNDQYIRKKTTAKPTTTPTKPTTTPVEPTTTPAKPTTTPAKPTTTPAKPTTATAEPTVAAKPTNVTAKLTSSASKYLPLVIALVSIIVIIVVAVVIFWLLKKFNFIDIHC